MSTDRHIDMGRALALVAVAAALEHHGLLPAGFTVPGFDPTTGDAVHELAKAVAQHRSEAVAQAREAERAAIRRAIADRFGETVAREIGEVIGAAWDPR